MGSKQRANGKKHRSYVKGVGNQTAVQTAYNSTTTEAVTFDNFDASGMSYRTTMSNGNAITGAGDYEGGPGEMDPLGGNMGVVTPYVEEPEPLPTPSEESPYPPIPSDAPMRVNGADVPCYIDGMRMLGGCSGEVAKLGSFYDWDWCADPQLVGSLGIYVWQEPRVEQPTITRYSIYALGSYDPRSVFEPPTVEPPITPPSTRPPDQQETCPPVPVHSANADIHKYMQTAAENGLGSAWNPLKPDYDLKAFVWFRDQVKNKGPWDYKQQGSQYQDFGNFNYGANGRAVGIDETTLLREAGRAQQAAGTSKPEWGVQAIVGSPLEAVALTVMTRMIKNRLSLVSNTTTLESEGAFKNETYANNENNSLQCYLALGKLRIFSVG